MTIRRATVIGVFSDQVKARAAVEDLKQAGFRDDQIGLAVRTETSATTTSPLGGGQYKERTGLAGDATGSHWEEGAGVGAAAGAATGAGLGLAIAAGLIPGIGPVIAGGTLAAILASTGTGAAAGAILGGLIGLGIPEEEAAYYDTEFRSGRTIVTVRADDRAGEAWTILMRHGAYDFDNRGDETVAPGMDMEATPY
ncbi:MAG TPA: hypothetical protein VH120_20495 [Gemmataceae bacterium]|jgi:hypothetical protein|nr:hypothetical protein [Gemmataceae bacterium]